MIIISEAEFREKISSDLSTLTGFDYVVGPGRSGAIAAVYASHIMGLPFLPYKCKIPNKTPLIVDTAMQSGRTLRKASRLYNDAEFYYAYREPPRVRFWYEAPSIIRGIGNEYPMSNISKKLGNIPMVGAVK